MAVDMLQPQVDPIIRTAVRLNKRVYRWGVS